MESSVDLIHPNILKGFASSFGKDDVSSILRFLEESRREIEDVYRGICPKRNRQDRAKNIWGGCVDETSCVTQKERKLDEDYRLEQALKRKKKKASARRRKVEICKCNYNPQCLVSLGGSMNAVLTRKRKQQQEQCTTIESESQIPDTNSLCSTNSESKNSGILAHVRKSIKVPRKEIKKYFESLNLSQKCSFLTYIDQIEKYHSSLLLPSSDDNEDSTMIQLSLPPGMINLGATCYLNSQIQCLTQNIAFQRGVLSWRGKNAKNSDDASAQTSSLPESGINAALYHLQDLLAKLQHTPNDTIDTTNFASSLNLLESEMQDPNEFSRLLLDRMMDLCPELKDLLKKIFEGTISYTTICKYCNKSRSRKETFMELTLPIPEIIQSESTKKGSKSKYSNVFSIKECLEEYLKVEKLHSENQYFCEACNRKRDANRNVSFVSLPPILQIQLGRYVFDVERNVKRKRMDEAKLPQNLNVKSGGEEKVYLLCGVLHHMGTSAYGGHYIAEGMDWTTGMWFEFNDKDVKMLENGPTGKEEENIGFEHEEENGMNNGRNKRLKGSSDAYSMFYVEKKFLKREVRKEVIRRTSNELKNDGFIESVMNERTKEYQKILKVQGELLLHQSKMNKRHDKVLTELFTPDTSLHLDPVHQNLRWVDGIQLRNFLSCPNYRLQEYQKDATQQEFLFNTKDIICSHNVGLHPRIARRGKLLTEQMHNALVSILEEEGYKRTNEHNIVLCSSKDLYCADCAASYNTEIGNKFETLMSLIEIFGEMETFPNPSKLEPSHAEDESQELHIVSSRFLTDLKRYALKKLKEVIKDKFIQEEGIDRLSFDEIVKGASILEAGGEPLIDPFVNTRITCHHNRLKQVTSRTIRILPSDIWNKILKLFPKAIDHTCTLPINGDKINTFFNQVHCNDCEREQKEVEKLQEWAQEALREKTLKSMIKGKARELNENPMSTLSIYFVKEKLFYVWKEAIEFYAGRRIVKEEDLGIFNFFEKISSNPKEEKEIDDDNGNFFHICSMHRLSLPIPVESLEELSNMIPAEGFGQLLKDRSRIVRKILSKVKVMNEIEYKNFNKSVIGFPHSAVKIIEDHQLAVKLDISEDKYSLHPSICSHCFGICSDENGVIMQDVDSFTRNEEKETKFEQNLLDKNNDSETVTSNSCSEISIHVHEVDGNTCVFTVAKTEVSLVSASAFSNQENAHVNEWSGGNVVRRSTRKRKARFQTAFTVKMNKTNTLARLRLLLYQQHSKSPLDQHLYLTILFKKDENLGSNPTNDHRVYELSNELNEKSFDTILNDLVAKETIVSSEDKTLNTADDDPKFKYWIYLQYKNNKSNKISKKERREIEDSLVSSLLMSDDQFEGSTVDKKIGRTRGTERGFHGTLLQSTASSSENPIKNALDTSSHSDNIKEVTKNLPQPLIKVEKKSTSEFRNGTKIMPIAID